MKVKKRIIIITSIVLVIALTIGGFFVYRNIMENKRIDECNDAIETLANGYCEENLKIALDSVSKLKDSNVKDKSTGEIEDIKALEYLEDIKKLQDRILTKSVNAHSLLLKYNEWWDLKLDKALDEDDYTILSNGVNVA